MLAKRIIPTILMKGRQLVKGERFKSDRVVGDALNAARVHAIRGVDEILLLDVSATAEGREPDYGLVEQLTSTARVPVTVGGGITSMDHIRSLLAAGAEHGVRTGPVQLACRAGGHGRLQLRPVEGITGRHGTRAAGLPGLLRCPANHRRLRIRLLQAAAHPWLNTHGLQVTVAQ